MKKKIIAFVFIFAVIVNSLPFAFLFNASAASTENLGTVSECKIIGDKLIISGSIKHSILISNRESIIAVYKLLPWENVENILTDSEPLSETSISISFSFEVSCTSIADKASLYAVVIIDAEGNKSLVSNPRYPDAFTKDTSKIGFKGVRTDNASLALASHAGSAVIDVYLDKLDNGNKSGHIFNADGDIFYFDRELIEGLDKQIESYSAMGCEVLLRFLISPGITNIPFCYDGRSWSTNKCVVVGDVASLNALYGYTYFLLSRYDGGDYGRVSGIILGRSADMPILYNYASLVSEDYDTVYARSLSIIGLAASEALSGADFSLIVPVSDNLTEKGGVYAESFLGNVADYVASHSKLTFTVMCESRHNPFHIYDSMFVYDSEPDEILDDGDLTDYSSAESVAAETQMTLPQDQNSESNDVTIVTDFDESTHSPEENVTDSESSFEELIPGNDDLPENLKPYKNTAEDGFYCSDSIELFSNMYTRLKKKYSSLNKGFAWCWYPDENTLEAALSVCYSYNYIQLSTKDVDFFVISFEESANERLSSIAHLFKYIDSQAGNRETSYAREVFEINDWSEIIKGYSSESMIKNYLIEGELQPNVSDYIGSLAYMNYSASAGVSGWYDGVHCRSVAYQSENGIGFLQADMALSEAGFNQAEIGYVLKTPEPLLLGDALTFDIQCGESDGSLYELAVYINCGESTIISKAVIAGGVRSALSVDVKGFDNTVAVNSLRITLSRLTGNGDCKFNLYSVTMNSGTLSDSALKESLENIRDYLRYDDNTADTGKMRRVIVTIVLLASVALISLLFAFTNDRRVLKSSENDSKNKKKE